MRPTLFLIFTILVLGSCDPARADYPEKAITLVVPFGPGGRSDRLYRITANFLAKQIGQPVNVAIMPGGGGSRGLKFVREQKPDGYTISMFSDSGGTRGVFEKSDFVPIAMIGRLDYIAVASRNTDLRNLSDLKRISVGRTLRIGTIGTAGVTAAAKLSEQLGLGTEIIPFTQVKSSTAYASLMQKEIDVYIIPLSSPLLQPNKYPDIVPLAVFSDQNIRGIPTAMEQGFNILASVSYGLVAPPDTDGARVQILENAIKALVENLEYSNQITKATSVVAEYQSGDDYWSNTQTAQNDYCKNCDCKDDKCKKECKKCD